MKGDNSEEVEIDLRDSSDPDEFDNDEEPQMLWRAPPALEDEENIHTSTLVEISDTKPLINVRDPRGINDCLKVLHSYWTVKNWTGTFVYFYMQIQITSVENCWLYFTALLWKQFIQEAKT